MTTLEIDTDKGHEDVELQIREMESHELLSIYDLFAQNPTVFQLVADELLFRKEHNQQLEHEGQIKEIEKRLK